MQGGGLNSRQAAGLRRILAIFAVIIVASGLTIVLLHTPAQPAYFYVGPGAAYDTARLVTVEKGSKPLSGHLYILTVNTQPASLFWRLYARLDSRGGLQPARDFLGGYPNYAEYLEDEAQMMLDSQMTAIVVAEQAAGLPARIEPQGAEVKNTLKGAPAEGILERGDIVIRVGATPVYSAEDLRRALAQYGPGDPVALTVRRGAATQSVTVTPRPAADDKLRAELGVYIDDARPKFEIPVPVKYSSGEITGPSAGLMFCLQIISQIQGKDIARGLVVTGTGTISAGGRVGPIGAVTQKVHTAEAAGADVMFLPRENYDEASKVKTRLRLVPVDTLQDALTWLQSYGGGR